MPTLFLRLLAHDDKPAALADAVQCLRDGQPCPDAYAVEPESFRQVPGAPFVYWVRERVRQVFKRLPEFQSAGRRLRLGDHPSNDFRYLRLHCEVPLNPSEREWKPYYKGGTNSPFYDETRLVVDWDSERKTYRDFYGRPGRSSERPSNYQYFLLPGLTFPYLPHRRGNFSHIPPGVIFGHASPVLQLPHETHWQTCALLNSNAFVGLLHLLMARGVGGGQTLKYEVGYVGAVPIPTLESESYDKLGDIAGICYRSTRSLFTIEETSHVFQVPALLQVPGITLAERGAAWQAREADAHRQLAELQREIDDIAFRLYGIDGEDRRAIEAGTGTRPTVDNEDEAGEEGEETDAETATDARSLVVALVSYAVGAVFGRWDLRYATGERTPPELSDPFAPLPVCSPGMLQGPDGLPPASAPEGYPLRIDADGLLVDDPDHPDDLIRRVREVLEVIWKDRAEAIEQEACDVIGVANLRDYFRKPGPGGFWDDHVKRYSKSRRKAPIYWLLQSSKKNYALWIDYHRLDKDILFKALLNDVEPKVRLVNSQLTAIRGQLQPTTDDGKRTTDKKLAKEAERLEGFLSELQDFEDRLRRAANLHLEPDLNDGVVLNIAPLWELVPWKEARNYWQELLDGKYEWSSIGKQLREKGLVKG